MTTSSSRARPWWFGLALLWTSAGCGDAATKDTSGTPSEQGSNDDAGTDTSRTEPGAEHDASAGDDVSTDAGDGDGDGDGAGNGDGGASGCALGECEPEGTICGGFLGLACAEHEFCNYALEAGGMGCDPELSDGTGVCESKPEVCTKQLAPVCGCDQVTYDNACLAHAQGISVLHSGPCAN